MKNINHIHYKFYDFIKKNELLFKVERSTSIVHNPGLSVSLVILVKTRILIEWMFKRFTTLHVEILAKRHNRKLNLEFKKDFALVLGNGPSLSTLDTANVIKAQANNELDIFVVNKFLTSKIYSQGVVPNFLILSDPLDYPLHAESPEIWKELTNNSQIKLIAPYSWVRGIKATYPEIYLRTIFFQDSSLEGFTRNTKPSRSRGYFQFTVFKGLAFASNQNYKRIFILGIDNSFFQTLFVDSTNQIWQFPNHASGTESEPIEMTKFFPGGVADYFYFISLLFKTLKDNFSTFPIFNLDQNSFIDSFPKLHESPYIHHLDKGF